MVSNHLATSQEGMVVGNSDQRGGLDTSMWLWSPLDWLEDANLSANKQLAKQY